MITITYVKNPNIFSSKEAGARNGYHGRILDVDIEASTSNADMDVNSSGKGPAARTTVGYGGWGNTQTGGFRGVRKRP